MKSTILYISAVLPARSETFVYRELFALESLGLNILPVSIHEPESGLGSDKLKQLSKSAIKLYPTGKLRMLIHAVKTIMVSPKSSFLVLSLSIFDFFNVSDVKGLKRFKIILQAVASLALIKRVKDLNVVHVHAHLANVPTTIAMYTAKHLGVSFSFTGHANDLFPNRVLLKEKIERSLFVSCISNWHREFYQSIFYKEDKFFPVIRCGVDTNSIKYLTGEHNSPLKILSVGRLVRKKGFDILINAIDILVNERDVNIEVIIAGNGPEEVALNKQIAHLSGNIQVKMLGETSNDTVFKLMGENDIFVLPLRIDGSGDRDGIPVVLMEAMAKGCCVISGDLVTIRELIDDGVSGFLVPTEDIQALVSRIEKLSLDSDLINKISFEARKKIETEFDLIINAKRFVQVLKLHEVKL